MAFIFRVANMNTESVWILFAVSTRKFVDTMQWLRVFPYKNINHNTLLPQRRVISNENKENREHKNRYQM